MKQFCSDPSLTFAKINRIFLIFFALQSTLACKNTDQINAPAKGNIESENLHICVDRPLIDFDIFDSTKKGGGLNSKVWANLPRNSKGQQILTVRFLGGSDYVKKRVIEYAKQWEPIANIELRFSDILSDSTIDPEIKISFVKGDGSWSYLGSDSKYFSPSMNFGWFDESTPDREFSRVVLHEFGHALSLIHEHQNPKENPIKWNKELVYKYFSGPPNFWSKKEIDANLFAKYSIDQINGSSFDSNSIMLYAFPASLTLDSNGTKDNYLISQMDKTVVKGLYGK